MARPPFRGNHAPGSCGMLLRLLFRVEPPSLFSGAALRAPPNDLADLRMFRSTDSGIAEGRGSQLPCDTFRRVGLHEGTVQLSNEEMNLTSHPFAEWLAGCSAVFGGQAGPLVPLVTLKEASSGPSSLKVLR